MTEVLGFLLTVGAVELLQAHGIPVVGGLGLREAAIRLWLHAMDEVGEADRILDKEDRHVISDEVENSLIRVEFDRKSPYVACEVRRPARTRNRREPDKHRRFA